MLNTEQKCISIKAALSTRDLKRKEISDNLLNLLYISKNREPTIANLMEKLMRIDAEFAEEIRQIINL